MGGQCGWTRAVYGLVYGDLRKRWEGRKKKKKKGRTKARAVLRNEGRGSRLL